LFPELLRSRDFPDGSGQAATLKFVCCLLFVVCCSLFVSRLAKLSGFRYAQVCFPNRKALGISPMGAGFAQVRLLFVVTVFDISHTKKSVFYRGYKDIGFVEWWWVFFKKIC
jgi:hypothetical protein